MNLHDDFFRNGLLLIAFVIAFYALVARERKAPDMVRSVYDCILPLIGALFLALISQGLKQTYPNLLYVSMILNVIAWTIITGGSAYIVAIIWKERNRHIFFRDDQLFCNAPIVRPLLKWWRSQKANTSYEKNPMVLSVELLNSLKESPYLPRNELESVVDHHKGSPELSISVVMEISSLLKLDKTVTDIAVRFLANKCYVQYASCTRHPIEFLMQLKYQYSKLYNLSEWQKIRVNVVAIDAYTPHFGFTDNVHQDRTKEANDLCLSVLTSARSYAGLHSALAEAFNKFKKSQEEPSLRPVTLVIYEGCHGLVDLESDEQYRIFVKHVLPSERLWGGMFSLFVESGISTANRSTLQGVANIFIPEPAENSAAPTANETGKLANRTDDAPAIGGSRPMETRATPQEK